MCYLFDTLSSIIIIPAEAYLMMSRSLTGVNKVGGGPSLPL